MIVLRNEDYYLYVEKKIVYSGNNGRPQYNYGIHLHSITKEEAEIVNETNYRDYMLKRDWITLVCKGHEGFRMGG